MLPRRIFLVVLLLSLFSASIIFSSASSSSSSSAPLGVLKLHSATINTAQTLEYHNDNALSANHRDASDDVNQYQYLFHYTDSYDSAAVESLLGFPLRRYIPDKGWHIMTTPKKVSQLRQMEGIQWVGAYHPDYKYHINILEENPHKANRRSLTEKFNYHFLSLNASANEFSKDLEQDNQQDIHDIHAVLPFYHESIDHVHGVAARLSELIQSTDASLHSRIQLSAISGDTILGHTNSEEDAQLLAKIVSNDHEIFYVTRRPIYHFHNRWSRGIVQTGNPNPNYDTNTGAITFDRPLRGQGQIIGVADSGLDWQSCFFHDFNFPNGPTITPVTDATVQTVTQASINDKHRKIVQYVAYADGLDDNGHGTHVCGSIAGQTSRQIAFSTVNGMAYEAKLAFFDIGTGTGGRLKVPTRYDKSIFPWAYAAGARIHSNSWGGADASYTQDASWIDTYMYDNKDFLILYAAGNDGHGPETIGTPSTAKNALTVGAASNSLESWNGIFCAGGFVPRPTICDVLNRASSGTIGAGKTNKDVVYGDNHVAGFSSNGPTKDGRNKPDVVAPGFFILSAKNGQSASTSCTNGPGTLMNFQAGTSMATPVTAGNVALIRQWFTDGYYPSGLPIANDGFAPSSALLKAMVIAGSRPLTGNVDQAAFLFSGATATDPKALDKPPSQIQGYGRIEVDQSIFFAGDKHRTVIFGLEKGGINPSLARTGAEASYDFCVVDPTSQLVRIALVWTDPPGTPNAAVVLVNDLDLVVTPSGRSPILGNQKMGSTTGTADRINPQELVTLELPANALNTDVNVKVSAANLPRGPQPFALVVVGNVRSGSCASGGGGGSNPVGEIFQWQASGWGVCNGMCKQSASSASPTQTRTVSCISSLKGTVDESICLQSTSNAGPKLPTSRACNTILCGAVEYEWTLGSYSGCTETCASAGKIGTQTRSVTCKTINVDWPLGVSEDKCSDHVKPPTLQQCNTNPCDGSSNGNGGLRWVASSTCTDGADACSSSCTCTRKVQCYLGDVAISESICTPANGAPRKPPTTMSCATGKCTNKPASLSYQWRAGDWGACSVGCGKGIQTRAVRCWSAAGYYDDDKNCEGLEKPPTAALCNQDACPVDTDARGPSNLEWVIGGWGRCDAETKTQKRWIVCANTNGRHDEGAKCEAHVGPQPSTTRSCTPVPFDSASWQDRDARAAYTWYLQEDRWSDPAKWCGGGQIYRYAWCLGLDGRVADTRSRCSASTKPLEERPCFTCARECPNTPTWYPGEYWMGCTTVDPCCGSEHRHVFCSGTQGDRLVDTSLCPATRPATTRDPCGECPADRKCGDYPNGLKGNTADGPPLPGSGVTGAPVMPPNGPPPSSNDPSASSFMLTSPSLMVMIICLFARFLL